MTHNNCSIGSKLFVNSTNTSLFVSSWNRTISTERFSLNDDEFWCVYVVVFFCCCRKRWRVKFGRWKFEWNIYSGLLGFCYVPVEYAYHIAQVAMTNSSDKWIDTKKSEKRETNKEYIYSETEWRWIHRTWEKEKKRKKKNELETLQINILHHAYSFRLV